MLKSRDSNNVDYDGRPLSFPKLSYGGDLSFSWNVGGFKFTTESNNRIVGAEHFRQALRHHPELFPAFQRSKRCAQDPGSRTSDSPVSSM
jgi:hypothetical protein